MNSTDRWLIGFRYHDLPGRTVRCFYLVDAVDPQRAQQIAAARANTAVERAKRNGRALDPTWTEQRPLLRDLLGRWDMRPEQVGGAA